MQDFSLLSLLLNLLLLSFGLLLLFNNRNLAERDKNFFKSWRITKFIPYNGRISLIVLSAIIILVTISNIFSEFAKFI